MIDISTQRVNNLTVQEAKCHPAKLDYSHALRCDQGSEMCV